jgi:hypothetical protein
MKLRCSPGRVQDESPRIVWPIFPRHAANELINSGSYIRRQTSDMKRAAIGVRMHSGWGALVAVSNSAGTIEVMDRRRVAITTPGTPGANQPYHFAENLELPEAEKFLGNCFAASKRLALTAVRDVVGELRDRQCLVVGSAVLLASGRPLPPLSKILASHALIHAAEGECFQTTFGKAAIRMRQQVSTLGRSLGPPWTKDQKTAALAALVVLATSKGDSRQSSLRGGFHRGEEAEIM